MERMTREQVNAAIAARIQADPGFLTRLSNDPHSALAELIGMTIPAAITITIHEETPTDIHLVVVRPSAELSEEDLEIVSGGKDGYDNASCFSGGGKCASEGEVW